MGRFIQIAMGSGAGLSYHLVLARDLGFLEGKLYQDLDSDLGVVMRMMSSLSHKIRSQWRKSGPQRNKKLFMNCHPERSEGSASCGGLQIPRFARDDKVW